VSVPPRLPGARRETALALVLFLALFLVPYFTGGYLVYIIPQYVLFGVLAMSLVLLWGFAGIVSFGQAALFLLGAYTMGLSLKGIEFANPGYVAMVLAIVIGAGLAGIIGYFLFTGGVRGSYFVLVTLAVSVIAEVLATSQSQITGGFNGMYIGRMALTTPIWGELSLSDDYSIYYFMWLFSALSYVGLRIVVGSKFGRVLVAIRENEDRTRALGFNTAIYKTVAVMVSGSIACLAGAMYGTHAQFVAPSLGGVLFSTEVVIWVAVGGRQYLLGGLIGGLGLGGLSNYLSSVIPEYWLLVIGVLFVATVVFFKDGVIGAIIRPKMPLQRRAGRPEVGRPEPEEVPSSVVEAGPSSPADVVGRPPSR
jgi:urea transport system permease protein